MKVLTAAAVATAACAAHAQTLQVPMRLVGTAGVGEPIGIITVTDAAGGLMLTPTRKARGRRRAHRVRHR
jgi:hypothetical protein